jgi:hypothetical protein
MLPSSVNKSSRISLRENVNPINLDNSNFVSECENEESSFDEKENQEYYEYINENLDPGYVAKSYKNNTFFKYSALDFLVKDDIPNVENVNICAFYVNQTGKFPFLQFLLNKFPPGIFDDMVTLPCFSYNGKNDIIDECVSKLDEVVGDKNGANYKYVGYLIEENEIYIFFDLSSIDLQVQELYRRDKCWFTLVDEIVNYKSVCNFQIHSQVISFFKNNSEFCTLYDENDSAIEVPIACYSGAPKNKLRFTAIFGIGQANNDKIMGPYYYFTNYLNAAKRGADDGVVRFAIFLGLMKVPMNYPNDEKDESEYKVQVLKDKEGSEVANDYSYECKIERVSDYDGKWTKNYNSVYLGKLVLEDSKTLISDAPYWIVKDYEQQTPLSYHHVNKRKGQIFANEIEENNIFIL